MSQESLDLDGLFAQAQQLYAQAAYEDCIACCAAVLEAAPTHRDALLLAGRVALQSGQAAVATDILEHGSASHPDDADLALALADAYVAAARPTDAIRTYQQVLGLDASRIAAHQALRDLSPATPPPQAASAETAGLSYAVRTELAQDYHVFYVTSWGYAADHWYGWLPKALNCHPEIFALLAHEGSRPKYMKERTRGERPPLVPFTHFLNDMGMTYQAIGDCYSYRASQMPEVMAEFGNGIPIVNIVRHPYVWLEFYIRWRTTNMRMPGGSNAPLEWEWSTVRHDVFEPLGLKPYSKEDTHIWAAYQGMWLANQVANDQIGGIRQMTLESIIGSREIFNDLVAYLTKGRCQYTAEQLDLVYSFAHTPFRGEEKLRMVPAEIYAAWPDWKKEAFELIVRPETKAIHRSFGYEL